MRLPWPPVVFPLGAVVLSLSDALLEDRDLDVACTWGEDTTGGSGADCRPPPRAGEMSLL